MISFALIPLVWHSPLFPYTTLFRSERLVEDPGAGEVLDAHRQVRVQDGRRLPVEQPERSPSAPPPRPRASGPRLCQPRRREQLSRERSGESQADHALDEMPPAQPADPHLVDQLPE